MSTQAEKAPNNLKTIEASIHEVLESLTPAIDKLTYAVRNEPSNEKGDSSPITIGSPTLESIAVLIDKLGRKIAVVNRLTNQLVGS